MSHAPKELLVFIHDAQYQSFERHVQGCTKHTGAPLLRYSDRVEKKRD